MPEATMLIRSNYKLSDTPVSGRTRLSLRRLVDQELGVGSGSVLLRLRLWIVVSEDQRRRASALALINFVGFIPSSAVLVM